MHEAHSEFVEAWVQSAEVVATCRIAYTEVMNALNVRRRKGDLPQDSYDLLVKSFIEDWKNFAKIDFDDLEAGNLTVKYDLSRLSAVHLSAAKLILREYKNYKQALGQGSKKEPDVAVFFLSEDQNLLRAAVSEGLKVLPLNWSRP
jgi:predicted nucleic acid-binding protein